MPQVALAAADVMADIPMTDPVAPQPFVTIVIPALNEEHYIETCIASLIGQWPEGRYEILVLDGGSTDRTREIVAAIHEQHAAVVLTNNPRRIQSAAVNLAAALASTQATIIVRADAHAAYAPDFVRQCVTALLTTGATSVVVPMHTRPRASGAFLQGAIAAAQSSRFGNGGAAHRSRAASGFVEHGHHAAFDLGFFRAIGGYDESFTHNEDAELDVRAIKAGGRIWMCAEAPVIYYPRERLHKLAQQYYRHGGGRARTLRKHRLRPRPRQVIPVAVLCSCVAAVAAAPFDPMLSLPVLLYPFACLGWGGVQAVRQRDGRMIAGGAALMTMHLAWAVGFLAGFARARRTASMSGLVAMSAGLTVPQLLGDQMATVARLDKN